MDKNDIASKTSIWLVHPKNPVLTDQTNPMGPSECTQWTIPKIATAISGKFFLNGAKTEFKKAHQAAVEYFYALKKNISLNGQTELTFDEYKNWVLSIKSDNNFPTSAGMASSASGFASFVLVLCVIFQYFGTYNTLGLADIDIDRYVENRLRELMHKKKSLGQALDPQDADFLHKAFQVNMLVRNVSGSACRSLFNGLVMTIGAELLLSGCSPFSIWSDKHSKLFSKNDACLKDTKVFLSKSHEDHFLSHLEKFYGVKVDSEEPKLYSGEKDGGPQIYEWEILGMLNNECVAIPYIPLMRLVGGDSDLVGQIDGNLESQKQVFLEGLYLMILVFEKKPKEVSSTSGMIDSSKTSNGLVERVRQVPDTVFRLEKAIYGLDYSKFNEIMMRDSNSLHSVC
jgi:mevalonate pyrophosphate decarboxylase